MASIKHALKCGALEGLTNDVSIKNYKKNIDKFGEWAKDKHKIRNINQVDNPRELVQEYADYLDRKRYSPQTIHTYLAPVCKGFGINLKEVDKPLRRASTITKTRDLTRNIRGQKQALTEDAQRIIEFQKRVGIRRKEIYRLKGRDFVKDVNGHYAVLVERGKGGKQQYQVILDKDVEFVKSYFYGKDPNEKIFTPEEMKKVNMVSLHSIRAEHARECYGHYLARVKNGEGEKLKEELIKYFKAYHKKDENNPGRFQKQLRRFEKDLVKNLGFYELAGDNKIRALELGRSVKYDRIALMCVSVFHLAHWRANIAATNYML